MDKSYHQRLLTAAEPTAIYLYEQGLCAERLRGWCYPANWDPVELCLPPFVKGMSTAIAIVATDFGIAIAADGLEWDIYAGKASDHRMQKIFPIGDIGLAYAVAGVVRVNKPNSDEGLFNFIEQLKAATEGLTANQSSLEEFVRIAAVRLLEAFRSATVGITNISASITHVLFAGYHRGPECVQLTFTHPVAGETFCKILPIELGLDIPVGYGSTPIWHRLLGLLDDADFTKYRPRVSFNDVTISRAVSIAKNCVLAHYDIMAHVIDPNTCKTIGGRIHAVTITLDRKCELVPT